MLSPVGTALLGYRVGDEVSWPTPGGARRLRIVAVTHGEAPTAGEAADVTNLYKVGQNTTRLLMAAGDVVIGWLLLLQAQIALEKLEAGASGSDVAFYTGKVAAAKGREAMLTDASEVYLEGLVRARTTVMAAMSFGRVTEIAMGPLKSMTAKLASEEIRIQFR